MDKRLKELSINLPNGWGNISADNPNGPPAFIDNTIDDPGVLQISTAEYLSGAVPNPSLTDLVYLSKNLGLKNNFGTLQSEVSGNCTYGIFGCVQFSSPEFPHISIWHLSDGKNFIFATFICSTHPAQKQVNDVKAILSSIKKKSFWASLFG
jgi:hypothetical protein